MRFSKPLWSWREWGMLSGSAQTRSSLACALAAQASATAARAFRKGEDMEALSAGTSLKLDLRHLADLRAIPLSLGWGGKACLPHLGGCRSGCNAKRDLEPPRRSTARLLRQLAIHRLHELDERAQLARRVGAIRIVEMKRLVRRQEPVEDRNHGAGVDLGGRELPEDETEPVALTRGAEHSAHLVENESAAYVNGHVLAVDTKFPFEEPRAVQAMADAVVFEQLVWRFRGS